MIDNGLAAGCLTETINDVYKQDRQDVMFRKWLAWGRGKSFKEFCGEDYGGE